MSANTYPTQKSPFEKMKAEAHANQYEIATKLVTASKTQSVPTVRYSELPAHERPSYDEMREMFKRFSKHPWEQIPETVVCNGMTVIIDVLPEQTTRIILAWFQSAGLVRTPNDGRGYYDGLHPVQVESMQRFGEVPYRGRTEEEAQGEIKRLFLALPPACLDALDGDAKFIDICNRPAAEWFMNWVMADEKTGAVRLSSHPDVNEMSEDEVAAHFASLGDD